MTPCFAVMIKRYNLQKSIIKKINCCCTGTSEPEVGCTLIVIRGLSFNLKAYL